MKLAENDLVSHINLLISNTDYLSVQQKNKRELALLFEYFWRGMCNIGQQLINKWRRVAESSVNALCFATYMHSALIIPDWFVVLIPKQAAN